MTLHRRRVAGQPEFETEVGVALIALPPRATLALARHKHAPLLMMVDDVPGLLAITCPGYKSKRFEVQAR